MSELPLLPLGPAVAEQRSSAPELDEAAQRFRVDGMDCAACARTVEKAVAALDGVQAARVAFGNATLEVAGDVDVELVEAAVERAGYRARPAAMRRATEPPVPFWRRSAQSLSTCLSVLLLAVAVTADLAGAARVLAEPLYLLSMGVGGWFIVRAAVAALAQRALDMNVLMSLAAVGAVGIGAYAEGAWVLVLFAVGTTIETFAFDRSRRSVEALMELAPPEARILDGEIERMVPVEEVVAGTLIVVRPGERVALDGEIADGSSSIDESVVTGESVPVDKGAGDEVFAGSLNAHGALTVRTTRSAEDSTLARIAALVEEAQGSKAPSERFVDRFARVYTPLVFAAALALLLVPVAFGGEIDTWLYRSLALLIVACPCSLIISIPVSVVSAVGGAARRGVLVKGGQALEDLAAVRTLAIDKTGTLTDGEPRVVDVIALGAGNADELLALAASVERQSEHPLAQAVVRTARDHGLLLTEPSDFRALPGRGAAASVAGRRLWTGGPRLVAERAGGAPDQLVELEARGRTAIALGEEDRVLALFGLADAPRENAATALSDVRGRARVPELVMLTGDNERVAAAVARQLGLHDWRAGLLPEDKLRVVEQLRGTGGTVAMVGDGINDAPALAAADVGIAMGAAGTDAALQSADVALMADDLSRLPGAILSAKRARNVMRQNVIASLAVKGVFVALAPLGFVTLVMAVAADMGMSLLVTLNGLRLLRSGEAPIGGRR